VPSLGAKEGRRWSTKVVLAYVPNDLPRPDALPSVIARPLGKRSREIRYCPRARWKKPTASSGGSAPRSPEPWLRLADSAGEKRLLENPTFREMNLVCVRCCKKVALRFSKTVLDSFFWFLPLRYEYREFDAEGRISSHADWIRPSVDS
jgi:hypothetical protein